MAIIGKDRITAPPLPPSRKKKGRPNNYKIIYRHATSIICEPSISILSNVFNMDKKKAWANVVSAALTGGKTLFIGSKDVAETKTAAANAAKEVYAKQDSRMMHISFTCEPL